MFNVTVGLASSCIAYDSYIYTINILVGPLFQLYDIHDVLLHNVSH